VFGHTNHGHFVKQEKTGFFGEWEVFNMSTLDTMTPIISSPWLDANGRALAVRPLPGLCPEVIKTLERAHPAIISSALTELLSACRGLADTDLGHIDFTGCCFPEEPCSVFNPCLTIAVDDAGRRWIAEVGDGDLPGPVWCVFPKPEVAVFVSDDLASFLWTFRDRASRGATLTWLQELTAMARAVWSHRRTLALRPHNVDPSDDQIEGWLSSLPSNAYVYDLRTPTIARGWPYGVAGPSGRLYRCGRLPVFAAAGAPAEGWSVGHPRTTSPIYPVAHHGLSFADVPPLRNWRMPRFPTGRCSSQVLNVSRQEKSPPKHCGQTAPQELPLCA
jgi:hypothetical protein